MITAAIWLFWIECFDEDYFPLPGFVAAILLTIAVNR